MDENPLGPKYCICKSPMDDFPCDQQMDAEDGLCDSCRHSILCIGWRNFHAKKKENA